MPLTREDRSRPRFLALVFPLIAGVSFSACTLDAEGRYVGERDSGADADGAFVDATWVDSAGGGQTGGTAGWPSQGGNGGEATGGTGGTGGAAGEGGTAGQGGLGGSAGAPACGVNEKRCDDACVPLGDPQFGCGPADCTPCVFDHGIPGCTEGECVLVGCGDGWGNCNAVASDGCETPLHADLTNCGTCGHVCSNAHGSTACSSGVCVPACEPGFADCDGDPGNGCELDTRSDVQNCGTCGHVCTAGFNCLQSNCGCAANHANCNGGVSSNVSFQCVQLSGADKCTCNGVQCEYGQKCVGTGQCG
jgi:hypothetical protein